VLNLFDDYPVHQTPEPIAHPATSDRNVYDRTWFNGYAADGAYYFGIGMAIYPHRDILDCAFSVIERNGRQHCFFGSRRAPRERTEMHCGPFRIEILEPMRRARVVLDDNPTGIACDLTFSARSAAIEEMRQTFYTGTRRTMDATRFDQFGRWAGEVRHPDGGFTVRDAICHGTKDRSWGVRNLGGVEPGGAPQPRGSICFVWAPLIWDDHVSNAIFFDGTRGEPLFRQAYTAPLYATEAAVPGVEDEGEERMAGTVHRITYHPGTRLARTAEIDLLGLDGAVRTIRCEPLLRFHMKGLGYFHPTWAQGQWQGELVTHGESYDMEGLDLAQPENFHTQQVVKVSDGTRHGIGVLEQAVFGAYAPAGFREFGDVAGG
jgi:hypothetical protein